MFHFTQKENITRIFDYIRIQVKLSTTVKHFFAFKYELICMDIRQCYIYFLNHDVEIISSTGKQKEKREGSLNYSGRGKYCFP